MRITHSTAAQRAAAASQPRGGWRRTELLALAVASVVFLAGMTLVYQAKTRGADVVANRLPGGRVLNLNAVDRPEQLLAALEPVIADSGERRFVAEQVAAWLAGSDGGRRQVNGVSALGLIQVSERDLGKTRRLPSFRERLAARKAGQAASGTGAGPGAPAVRVPLLTGPQLAALRPALSVRAHASFRSTVLWAALLFLAGFYLAHAWMSFRGSTADQVLLPAVHLLCGIGLVMMVSLRDPVRDPMLFWRFSQGTAAGCVALAAVVLVDFQRTALRRLSYVPLIGAVALSAVLIVVRQRSRHERRQGQPARRPAGRGHPPAGRAVPGRVLRPALGVRCANWRSRGVARSALRPRRAPPRLRPPGRRGHGARAARSSSCRRTSAPRSSSRACSWRCTAWRAAGSRWWWSDSALLLAGFAGRLRDRLPAHRRRSGSRCGLAVDNAVRGGDQVAHAFWALGDGRRSPAPASVSAIRGSCPRRTPTWSSPPSARNSGSSACWPSSRCRPCWPGARRESRSARPATTRFFLALGLTLSLALQLLLIASGPAGPDAADRRGHAVPELRAVVDDRQLRWRWVSCSRSARDRRGASATAGVRAADALAGGGARRGAAA